MKKLILLFVINIVFNYELNSQNSYDLNIKFIPNQSTILAANDFFQYRADVIRNQDKYSILLAYCTIVDTLTKDTIFNAKIGCDNDFKGLFTSPIIEHSLIVNNTKIDVNKNYKISFQMVNYFDTIISNKIDTIIKFQHNDIKLTRTSIQDTVRQNLSNRFEFSILNNSNLRINGKLKMEAYLSKDTIFDPSDSLIPISFHSNLINIPSKEYYFNYLDVNISNSFPLGSYYILGIINRDSAIFENNFSNNISFSKIELIGIPDYSCKILSYPNTIDAKMQTLNSPIVVKYYNIGNGTIPNIIVNIGIKEVIGYDSKIIIRDTIQNLNFGDSLVRSYITYTNINYPIEYTDYYKIFVEINPIEFPYLKNEVNFSNNIDKSIDSIVLTSAQKNNLKFHNVKCPTNFQPGDKFICQFTIENLDILPSINDSIMLFQHFYYNCFKGPCSHPLKLKSNKVPLSIIPPKGKKDFSVEFIVPNDFYIGSLMENNLLVGWFLSDMYIGTQNIGFYYYSNFLGNGSKIDIKPVPICVNDTTKPILINCPKNFTKDATDSTCVYWTPPQAYDYCSTVQLSSNYKNGSYFKQGIANITYTAVDASGNSNTCSFVIQINNLCSIDSISSSKFQCPSDIVIYTQTDSTIANWYIGYPYSYCSNISTISNYNSGSYFKNGITPVNIKITDTLGNSKSCNFNVNIKLLKADITLSNLTIKNKSLKYGDNLELALKVRNIGNVDINNIFRCYFYLSTDPILSSRDIKIGQKNLFDLSAGSFFDKDYSLPIPISMLSGNYYLILVIDADNRINEIDESNNILVSSEPITYKNNIIIKKGKTVGLKGNNPIYSFAGNNTDNSYLVAPNPAEDYINVNISEWDNEALTLKVFNTLGIELQNIKLDASHELTYKVNLQSITSGLYYMYIQSGEGESNAIQFVKR